MTKSCHISKPVETGFFIALSPLFLSIEEVFYAYDNLKAKIIYKKTFAEKKPFFDLTPEEFRLILDQAKTYRTTIKQKESLCIRETQVQYMLATSFFTYNFWLTTSVTNDFWEQYEYIMPMISFLISTCSLLNVAKSVIFNPNTFGRSLLTPKWLF